MAIPPLVLRIYADSSGVKRGVAQAQAQVGGLRASIARNAGLIKTGLLAGVVGGMVVAVKSAGDLGEAINAVNVTFKDNARTVRAWAEQAATSAGLAEGEALQAAAGFGAMLDSAGIAGDEAANMSVKVAQLAGDIASLRNADPTEMLERMRAGLAGEAEPLRRFGIFISEARVQTEAYSSGIAKAGEELTDAQKIQARYNIILRDSDEAAGDFARTAGDSLPNQLRILRAQLINLASRIGSVVLPIITGLLRIFNRIVDFVANNLLPVFRSVANFLTETFGPAWNAIKGPARSAGNLLVRIGDEIAGAFGDAAARIREMFAAWDQFVNEVVPSGSTPGGWFNNLFGGGNDQVISPGEGGNPVTGRQHGGTTAVGHVYRINENRAPELFVPHVGGTVVPLAQTQGGAQTINLYLGDELLERVVVKGLNRAAARA